MLFVRERVDRENEEALTAFKKKLEADLVTFKKKLDYDMWPTMANYMKEIGADDYTGGAVEKAYIKEKRENFPHRATMEAVIAASDPVGGAQNDEEGELEAAEAEDQAYGEAMGQEAGEDADMDEA
jgi:hypothetical protein